MCRYMCVRMYNIVEYSTCVHTYVRMYVCVYTYCVCAYNELVLVHHCAIAGSFVYVVMIWIIIENQ